MLLSVSLKSGD